MSKEWRSKLRPEDYAVPAKEKLPFRNTPDDVAHTRLAWDMVDRTKGLSDEERSEARKRILERAKELGIDTKNWKLTAGIYFEAVALEMPEVDDHPNRMPFSGVLVRVDQASDAPPGGSSGHCTYIPTSVAEAALPSLLGMAVDFTPNLDGHNKRSKIGIITEAEIDGDAIHIKGFFYASDFPEECARIKAEKDRLGFSYECQARIQDLDADPWVFEHCVFTGAAVLLKHLAAYQTTSLAASADQELETEMDPKLKEIFDQLVASMAAVTKEVADLKANAAKVPQNLDANATHDKVKPHADRLRACAAAMEADGIGTHPTNGHANVLRHMAAKMEGESLLGTLPHIYRDHDFLQQKVEATMNDEAKKRFEAIEASIASVATVLNDVKAKAFEAAAAPQRQTLSPEVRTLLAKAGMTEAAEDGSLKLTASQVDEMFAKLGLTGSDRIAARLKLRESGVLTPGTRH